MLQNNFEMMYNSPEDFIQAIDSAFEQGEYPKAQQLAFQAVEHYPEHEEILKYLFGSTLISHIKPSQPINTSATTTPIFLLLLLGLYPIVSKLRISTRSERPIAAHFHSNVAHFLESLFER